MVVPPAVRIGFAASRLAAIALAVACFAMTPAPLVAQAAAAKLPIADNSFLMEEAYNQEKGVIQHISLFQKVRDGDAWMYGFTQEWPVRGQRHQFSYTIPFSSFGSSTSGVGDLMLNWRIQTKGSEGSNTWISPRLSLIVPTGDYKKGLGNGVLGVQGAIPISHRLAESIVSHTNIGATFLPGAKAGPSLSGNMYTLSAGQSFIWEARPRLNFMLETVYSNSDQKIENLHFGTITTFISPGVRWGWDFSSGLQIVPGVAFPIGVGASKDEKQVLLYVSFEHPLKSMK